MIRRLFQHLRHDVQGATMVEFAVIATPLCMILLGLTDFGYRSYVDSMVEGTLHRAARMATVGNKTPNQIDDFVRSQLSTFSSNGTVTITKKSYYQFSNVDKEEPHCANNWDKNNNGIFDTGDCYQDINNNGSWDSDSSKDGIGGSDDIVFYSVSLTYPRVVPLGNLLGWANTQTISANTLMRNQPYGSQATPPERTRT
jgi:Flp pilus assembly protein TadG